jgi:hypothetical protein
MTKETKSKKTMKASLEPATPTKTKKGAKIKAPTKLKEPLKVKRSAVSTSNVESSPEKAPTTKMEAASTADRIWVAIANRTIDMFGLPDQRVHMHVTRYDIDPEVLFLKPKSTAVVPQLEASLAPDFEMNAGARFIEVTAAKSPVKLNSSFQGIG